MPKVGDILKRNSQFEALPVDSIIQPIEDRVGFYRRKKANGKWTHETLDINCDHQYFVQEYRVSFIPGESSLKDSTPEPDPIQDLADELWDVRNEVVSDQGYYYQGKTPHHNEVYRALAEFVLRQYDHDTLPEEVVDGQGDTWTLRSNKKYALKKFSTIGSTSYSDIRKFYGVQS